MLLSAIAFKHFPLNNPVMQGFTSEVFARNGEAIPPVKNDLVKLMLFANCAKTEAYLNMSNKSFMLTGGGGGGGDTSHYQSRMDAHRCD